MRLTVGPLPPAVYWRRRALVLGALVLPIVLLCYACGGPDDTEATPAGAEGTVSRSPSPAVYPGEDPSGESPTDDVSAGDGDSVVGDPGTGSGGDGSGDYGGGSGEGSDGEVPACSDSDLSVVPEPVRTRTLEGARLRIDLVITNISGRPCERDIGADQQEITVMDGEDRIWSSDHCNPQQGSHREVLRPGVPVDRFWVTWDGRTSAPKCEGERELVPPGRYSVVARLGELTSEPVRIEVVSSA